MPSPWQSGLAKLDAGLQPFQSQLERLQAGLEVSDAELFHSLEQAQQNAAAVRDLILAERPNSSWSDRESLEQVIQQLEDAAREQINQQRRDKLLELANELEAGTVKHRVEARTTALNALRLEAVGELRNAALATELENELPGPEASEWLLWAAGLEEEKDAATVAYLRRDYPTLERFAGELDERYWKPVARPESQIKAAGEPTPKAAEQTDTRPSQVAATASDTSVNQPSTVSSSSTSKPTVAETISNHNYRSDKTAQGATTALPMTEAPVNSTVNMFKVPSRERSRVSAEEPKVEPVVIESIPAEPAVIEPEVLESSTDSSEETMPSFGVLSQAKRPAAIWIAAAAGVILLCAVFAGIYRSSAKASNSPGGTAPAKADIPPPAAVPAQPVVKQAIEGAQRLTALDLERCQRLNPGSVQCWGYVSNVGTDPARISLQSVDVVDGKGNTFNLHGVGQLDFATGRSSNISGGDRAKYTVTVPDKDPNAKMLTLYVDVTNPHALEYTFRDVPIT